MRKNLFLFVKDKQISINKVPRNIPGCMFKTGAMNDLQEANFEYSLY